MKAIKKIIVIVLILCMVGCSSKKPSDTVNSYLSELQKNVSQVLGDNAEIAEADQALYEALVDAMKEFEYEIVGEEINEDKAEVKVKIKTYALGSAFTSAFAEYISQAFSLALGGASQEMLENLIYQIWSEKIAEEVEKGKLYSNTITLELKKENNDWVISDPKDEELVNAITGDLVNILNSLSEQ